MYVTWPSICILYVSGKAKLLWFCIALRRNILYVAFFLTRSRDERVRPIYYTFTPLMLIRDNIAENTGGELLQNCLTLGVASAYYICPYDL
jgi:hypothetical protein